MSAIWVALQPGSQGTRLLATAGSAETLLKGMLARRPQHPQAVATLLSALALWQGAEVHAALAVDDPGGPSALWPECFADFGRPPLYTLEVVSGRRARLTRAGVTARGDYRDLRRLLVRAVAR
ncbi:MAG TPA: hypothetical protein VGQ83_27435 [Polyangia bacterium]|jgi:hypothetical protein